MFQSCKWLLILLAFAGIVYFGCSGEANININLGELGNSSSSSDNPDESSSSNPFGISSSGGSSSSATSTSSSSNPGGATLTACIEPMHGTPPNGKETCIKVGNKCYMCNPDRGNECLNDWVWQGSNVSDAYWYSEISCEEANGGDTHILTCNGLATTGTTGIAIAQPTVKCDNATVAPSSWTGAPAWSNPTAGTYNVSVTANCGGSNTTVSCGALTVTAPSSLTCTGLPQTGIAGTAITQPTVRCNNAAVTPSWTGAPTWSNPTVGTYNVSVTANCGGSSTTVSCGILKVNPKLACGSVTGTVIAGTAVTPPSVTCGSTTLANNNIQWTGAPSPWSAPPQGTYNNVKAKATSGDCNGQEATCSGTLTVNPKLTCGSVTQTITTAQTPTKPTVTCGSSSSTNITWSPNINNALAAGSHSVTATASCGGSNQTATCAGTITVTAVGGSSSSGGGNTLTPITSGGDGWASRYWDGCKPSCGWSGNAGGNPTRSCGINGVDRVGNDTPNKCMDNGNAHTCYSQAPFVVGNVAYAFAASHTNGDCGKCFQLTFKGTSQHAASSAALNFIKNKSMIIKISNIGGDVNGNQFDLMIPGGGLGAFDGFTMQTGVNGSVINGSERYGGFVTDCGGANNNNTSVETLQNCLNTKCDNAFTNTDLRNGCKIYGSWFGAANNPQFWSKEVTCPQELQSKW